ncbi:TPA: hypothetical protein ACPYW0_004164 [Citrobacter freundii]|nr:hypothetical protein [Citrobacter freundii]HDT1355734.1 hypothetical protein [Citrobacter freundii]
MTTNHPAHGPVSLERLHQISEILSKAAAQSDGGNLGYAMADAVKVIDGAIAAFSSEPQRNPVLTYADSYRDMAERGVESIPVWSVIIDLERNIAPLYTAPPAPVVPTFDEWLAIRGDKPLGWVKDAMRESYDACRAAMLQHDPVCTCPSGDGSLRWPCPVHPGNSPVTPDGWALVPKRLTAENGAKGVLSGEFSETKFINCPECFGDDECETCDGSGRIEITVPVSWTNIKAIWAKGVEHFEAAPQQENV